MRGSVRWLAGWCSVAKVLLTRTPRFARWAVTGELAREGQPGRFHHATSGNYATSGRYVVLASGACQCTRAEQAYSAGKGPPRTCSRRRGRRVFQALSPNQKGRPEGRFDLLKQAREDLGLRARQLGLHDRRVCRSIPGAGQEGL